MLRHVGVHCGLVEEHLLLSHGAEDGASHSVVLHIDPVLLLNGSVLLVAPVVGDGKEAVSKSHLCQRVIGNPAVCTSI